LDTLGLWPHPSEITMKERGEENTDQKERGAPIGIWKKTVIRPDRGARKTKVGKTVSLDGKLKRNLDTEEAPALQKKAF